MQAFAASPFVEAPAMFKRRGTYYALFGKCCAFCAHGSGVGVWVSVRAPPPHAPGTSPAHTIVFPSGCAASDPLGLLLSHP
jgi:hypothetical protein